MAHQYSPKKFIRQISKALLRQYFQQRGVLQDLPWADVKEGDVDPIVDAIEALPAKVRDAIEGDFTLVTEMATDGGSVLIRDDAEFWKKPWAARLDEMRNGFERAFLALLEDRELLETAAECGEMDRFADSRWWRRFVGKRLEAADDEKAIGRLEAGIRGVFKKQGRGRQCHIERCERRKPERFCYFAFPENFPKTDLGYDDNNRFGRQTRRTAMEIIFVYRPEEGMLEMVAGGDKRHKEALAEVFCTTILGLKALPAANQKPPYDLSVLKRRDFAFTTDPKDNIERVEVRQLRFDLPGSGNRRLVASARPTPDNLDALHDLLDEAINQTRFPLSALQLSQAKLSMRFRGQNGRRGKVLTFEVTYPDRCNLKDNGHDAIAKKYLLEWEIARA